MELGQCVEWESQAQGVKKKKQGVIVGVVPANSPKRPIHYLADVSDESEAREKYSTGPIDGCGFSRNHESYLVAVSTGKTDAAKKTLYWPRVSALSLA
jgi:hypothetical protein